MSVNFGEGKSEAVVTCHGASAIKARQKMEIQNGIPIDLWNGTLMLAYVPSHVHICTTFSVGNRLIQGVNRKARKINIRGQTCF